MLITCILHSVHDLFKRHGMLQQSQVHWEVAHVMSVINPPDQSTGQASLDSRTDQILSALDMTKVSGQRVLEEGIPCNNLFLRVVVGR